MIDYNYLFDLTPISPIEQLICSDWLEDQDQEILAHCLRFGYKTINFANSNKVYPYGKNVYGNRFGIGYGHGKEYGFSIEGNGEGCDNGSSENNVNDYVLGYFEGIDDNLVVRSRHSMLYNVHANGCGYYQIRKYRICPVSAS